MALQTKVVQTILIVLVWGTVILAAPLQDHRQLIEDAKGGDREAQYTLGHLYLKGRGGMANDADSAIFWLEQAARQGHQDGAFDLALLYLEGVQVEKDTAQALVWLEQAAGAEHLYAQYYLGLAYLESEPATAKAWLKKAARNGSKEASSKLENLCADEQIWCN